jgi:tetratricopeptide (TPR) repeat protein
VSFKKSYYFYLIFIACNMNYHFAVSQRNIVVANISDDKVAKEFYNFTRPYFSGKGFADYISNEMNFNKHDMAKNLESCVLTFKLSKNNEVSDLKMVDSTSNKKLNNQFYNAILTSSGKWEVAKINGKAIDINITAKATVLTFIHSIDASYTYLIDNLLTNNFYSEGVSLSSNNEFSEAIKYFDQVLKISSADVDAFFNRGICKYKSDDKTGACEDWNKIQAMGKTDADKLILKYCNQ